MTAAVLDHTPVVTPRPAARRASPARLTGLEIRKSLSTRSGRTLVGAAGLLPAGGAALVFALGEQPPNAAMLLAVLGSLVGMLLIAVGVLEHRRRVDPPHRADHLPDRAAAGPGESPPSTPGWRCSARSSPRVVVGSVYAVAAVGADPGFSWQGAVPAAVATVANRCGAHRRRRRHRRRRGQRAGRADRHVPRAAGRDEHPQRGQAPSGRATSTRSRPPST